MDGAIHSARVEDIEYIKFFGTVRYSHCAGLEAHIDKLFEEVDFSEVVIDLDDADILDSTALGLLAKVAIEFRKHSDLLPVVFVKQGELFNILKRVCFDQVFKIILDDKADFPKELDKLAQEQGDEQQVLDRVVKAHEYLAKVDKKNEQLFKDITQAIKK